MADDNKAGSRDLARKFEALRREIDDMFRAAERRSARFAAEVARELHLERLAERFRGEAERDDGRGKE